MDITALPEEVPGFEVNLENVAVWVIREMRLHGSLPDDITFKLSIDGRPFHGKGTRVLYTSPCFFLISISLVSRRYVTKLFLFLQVNSCCSFCVFSQ